MLKRTIIMLSILGISQNLHADAKPFLEYGKYECQERMMIITDANGKKTPHNPDERFALRIAYSKDKISKTTYYKDTKKLRGHIIDAEFNEADEKGIRYYVQEFLNRNFTMMFFIEEDDGIFYIENFIQFIETLDGDKETSEIRMYRCDKL